MRNSFIDTIFNQRKINKKIFFISGDLGYSVIDKFAETFPDSFLNAGISEQNMTLLAAGISKADRIVFTYSIGNFNSLRVLEQIRNNICYNNLNVKIVSIGAGLGYGQLGFTHHLTEDIGIMKSLPNLTVFSPADSFEAQIVTELAINHNGPCYIRLGKGKEENIHNSKIYFGIGEAIKINEGSNVAILVTGNIIIEANKVVENLMRIYNINCGLFSFPTIKPLDSKTLSQCISNYQLIFTIEEGNVISGFGSSVAQYLIENNYNGKFKAFGINDCFLSIVGDQKYLLKQVGLDSDSLLKKIENFL
jgi:transketolase